MLNLIGVTTDDLFTTVLVDSDTGQTLGGEPVVDVINPTTPLAEALLGVAPAQPKCIWRGTQFDRSKTKTHSMYKAPVRTMMTGGRSPTIVNQAQCVSGDTLIQGPRGRERIDTLARRGTPFHVWALTPDGQRVPATAMIAFKKGAAELFRYTLEDGRSIKTTGGHRFLTPDGYQHAADLKRGDRLATADHDHARPSAPRPPRPEYVNDEEYKAVPVTGACRFQRITKITPLGLNDFYDMYVPGWQNYSANGIWNHNTFGIKYGLAQIKVTNVAGVFASTGPAPVGSGLASLYQGQLDNTLLAWERITDPTRAVWTGDLAYQEHFERGSQTAYTLASILTLRQADWNTRAYYGFQTDIVSGCPWVIDVDIRLGERGGWEFNDVIFVDQLTGIKRSWDRHSPVMCSISVGDDKDKQDPIARSLRAVNAIYGLIGALAGEGTIFG